jgi:hypothetical protein
MLMFLLVYMCAHCATRGVTSIAGMYEILGFKIDVLTHSF